MRSRLLTTWLPVSVGLHALAALLWQPLAAVAHVLAQVAGVALALIALIVTMLCVWLGLPLPAPAPAPSRPQLQVRLMPAQPVQRPDVRPRQAPLPRPPQRLERPTSQRVASPHTPREVERRLDPSARITQPESTWTPRARVERPHLRQPGRPDVVEVDYAHRGAGGFSGPSDRPIGDPSLASGDPGGPPSGRRHGGERMAGLPGMDGLAGDGRASAMPGMAPGPGPGHGNPRGAVFSPMTPGPAGGPTPGIGASTGRTGGPVTGPVTVGSATPGLGAAPGPPGSSGRTGSPLVAPPGIMAVARRDDGGAPPSPSYAGGGEYRPGGLGHIAPYNPTAGGGVDNGGGHHTYTLASNPAPGRGIPDGAGGGFGYEVTPGLTGRGGGGGTTLAPDGLSTGSGARNDGIATTPNPRGPGTMPDGNGPRMGLPSYGATFRERDSIEGVPSIADMSDRQGWVVVEIKYDDGGRVTVAKDVKADVPDNSLRNAAVRDARQQRIAVGMKDGKPQGGTMKLKYVFEKGKPRARVMEFTG